ncbi:hypothetical protein CANINC_001740 [Pichia inconspicua]|uniref:Low-affinity Fe(2+) transport protein n=1 Tax=Pichia inconspicua TaxID=52247 RepID=A0A4T0X2S9_9ASCO|nr:hypothetical protein CANINC_001740 [[Candida] inconspicua]
MGFWSGFKIMLVPPHKGDIRVRCEIACCNDDVCSIRSSDNEKCNNDPDKCLNENDVCENQATVASSDIETSTWKKISHYIPHQFKIFKKKEKKKIENIKKLEEFEIDNDFASPLDTFIGWAVEVTASVYMLWLVIFILIAWIVWGAATGAPDVWQIAMQDGQSIQTYVWDTFLMRQQLDDNEKFLILSGKLKSRVETLKRLIAQVQKEHPDYDIKDKMEKIQNLENHEFRKVHFRKKTWFDKLSEWVSLCLGNLYAVIIYWIGIFVWIGCGKIPNNNGTKDDPLMQTFSNNWQMYINTATAIELLFTSVFLEHVRASSNDFIMEQIKAFNRLDYDLEALARQITSDTQENELITVKRCPRDKIQSWISVYANIIGNGLGLIISTCVFIAWFCIGHPMHWNDNWWLVIGTYTGLVGFIDGFVLREVFFSLTSYEHQQFYDLFEESQGVIDQCGIPYEMKRYKPKVTFDTKISLWINDLCSNKWSVVASVVVVIGLIIMACAMVWSETAQLICNTPTMIIEGFFLLILIQAHNWADAERSNMVGELVTSRMYVYNYFDVCFNDHLDEDEKAEIERRLSDERCSNHEPSPTPSHSSDEEVSLPDDIISETIDHTARSLRSA